MYYIPYTIYYVLNTIYYILYYNQARPEIGSVIVDTSSWQKW